MDKDVLLRSSVHYYCFEGYYHCMHVAASEGVRLFPSDFKYSFYKAISFAFEAYYQESIRELETLQNNQDFKLALSLALADVYLACKTSDHKTVNDNNNNIRNNRKCASEKALYFAGLYLLFTNRLAKARKYIDKIFKSPPTLDECYTLKGWLELMSNENENSNTIALNFFEHGNDVEAVIGKARCLEKNGSFLKSIEILNQMYAVNPKFLITLFEKMRLQLAIKDWNQVDECANLALTIDRYCIQPQLYLIVKALVWETNHQPLDTKLSELIQSLELREPQNSKLYYHCAQLLSHLSKENKNILSFTFKLVEKANLLDPNKVEYIVELGYQCILLKKAEDGLRYFNNALKLDEANVPALLGTVHCLIFENADKAKEKLNSFQLMNKSASPTKYLVYLNMLLDYTINNNRESIKSNLEQIIDLHVNGLRNLSLSLQYYLELDPNFIIHAIQLYIENEPAETLNQVAASTRFLEKVKEMLKILINCCPVLHEPIFLISKLYFMTGDYKLSLHFLENCITLNQTYFEAYILKAKILTTEESYQAAEQILEIAMGQNFEIRNSLEYILVKVEILKHQKKFDEALKILKNLLVNLKESKKPNILKKSQQITISLQMIELYTLNNLKSQAEKLTSELLSEFKESGIQARVLIAKANQAEHRGDIEEALSILRDISIQNIDTFIVSREKMANIYLKHRKDRRLYVSCYRDICDRVPTIQSFVLLGDAYMNILEPEKAIEIYEETLKKNPKDGYLTRKVGEALITTHFFEKAITFYRAMIKTNPYYNLRYDLALLLFKMKRYQDSQDLIISSLEIIKKVDNEKDIAMLELEAKLIHLLAKVQMHTHQKETILTTLQKAHEIYARLFKRFSVEKPDNLDEIRTFLTEISSELVHQLVHNFGNHTKAFQVYKDTLNSDPNNLDILIAMAELQISNENLNQAHKYLNIILKINPNHNHALLMIADLKLRENDFEKAFFHFEQLMNSKPNYYNALAKLIEAARRVGSIEKAKDYIKKAEEFSTGSSANSELDYCKGLYFWYTYDANEAIKYFNRSRINSEIALKATYHMIEIFINPERGIIGGETFEAMNMTLASIEIINAQEASIRAAEKLLSEIREKNDIEFILMSNFVLLARKQKSDAETALNSLIKVLNDPKYKNHPGAIFGVSTAYLILKQIQKSRNQLKRVIKLIWNYSDAEYLEKCWLLLADIYIQSGKYESAREYLQKVLQYNKCCVKAYEYLGFIGQRMQNLKETITNLEMAWNLTNHNNSNTGYKLALSYIKVKKYSDAIDIARIIMNKYPDHPRIKKDVFDKALACLKT